ncbi:MmgE/PrpD family protein [Mitsuokella multacida]|uniref:MmgE/PrpD family protein n=1 Tax=Mitsuokella multacida TaxID=52226 RepID=UPI003FED9498
MDQNTTAVVRLIEATELSGRDDLIAQAKRAFLDYLAALLAARREPAVENLRQMTDEGRASDRARLYGFASHYLDFDDAQANIAGHFSTVLYSVLLAVARPDDAVCDFLAAYIAGAELEGLLGARINPEHRRQGWHSTGTVGTLGAAAAIMRLRRLTGERAAEVLSLAGTQSAGMAFEAGSDGKPLHAGFAAEHAVTAFHLVEAGMNARTNLFDDVTGWLAVFTDGQRCLDVVRMQQEWLQPGQILEPGLWMKRHMYCSAAICAADGAEELYRQGLRMADVRSITVHFPPGADRALRYTRPQTGREGQFSVEFIIWQILQHGRIEDAYFRQSTVPQAFLEALPKFRRAYDVPAMQLSERAVPLTAETVDGRHWQVDVREPQGSPARPLTIAQQKEKLEMAVGSLSAGHIIDTIGNWPDGEIGPCLDWIKGEMFP